MPGIGKVRTNDDKRRAVDRVLGDADWRRWTNLEIARHCGVSEFLVRQRRRIFDSIEDNTTRTVQRGDTTYEMDTSCIGKVEPAAEPPEDLKETPAYHPTVG